MQPTLLIIILTRKTQVLGHIPHLNRRLPKRPLARRPYHLPIAIRELLRRTQMIIVIIGVSDQSAQKWDDGKGASD